MLKHLHTGSRSLLAQGEWTKIAKSSKQAARYLLESAAE